MSAACEMIFRSTLSTRAQTRRDTSRSDSKGDEVARQEHTRVAMTVG